MQSVYTRWRQQVVLLVAMDWAKIAGRGQVGAVFYVLYLQTYYLHAFFGSKECLLFQENQNLNR